jgi:hypothetical protein
LSRDGESQCDVCTFSGDAETGMKLHGRQIGLVLIGLFFSNCLSAQTLSKTDETAIPTTVMAIPETLKESH